MIDLDANATTRPCDAAIAAANRVMADAWHNPSSIHRAGQDARAAVELARQSIASLINAKPRDLVFTSGATESIELALRGTLTHGATLVISTGEHAAVRDLATQLEQQGQRVVRVPIDAESLIDPADIARAIDGPAVVSVHWANGETGAIQPVEAIAALCRERGAVLHVDASQWVGRMPTDVAALDADLVSFSPHKWHGIKGVGVLHVARGLRLTPTRPGAQELGRRSGTEPVPAIAAAGAAAEAAGAWLADPMGRSRQADLRDRLEAGVLERVRGGRNGPDRSRRVWTTANLWFEGVQAEPLLLALSERGVLASAGAACSSGSLEPSPVLLAMGLSEIRAESSVRFSLSRLTTESEIEAAIDIVAEAAMRAHS